MAIACLPTPFPTPRPDTAPRWRRCAIALAGCLAIGAAHADERADLEQLRATTLGLIQALIDQGLISGDRAQALLRQANARPTATVSSTAGDTAARPAATPASGVVRVPYIPETLRAQLKEEIKLEVLGTARDEGWADARKFPDWLSRISLAGDLRVREESDLLPSSNSPASLYRSQTESPAWSPDYTNTQTNRTRLTLRARLGVNAVLSDDVTTGLRLSTGVIPSSASQTLGSSPGYFNRYSFGLDRAWVRWEPRQGISIEGGRVAPPFVGTDLLWPEDLSLDGIDIHAEHNIANGAFAFLNLGAFAIQELELTSSDKWLFGAQVGTDWSFGGKTNLRVAAGLFDFRDIEGVRETSPAPSGALAGTVAYQTSEYRSGARLHGNTLINLNDPTNTGTPVWGLASKFRPLNLNANLTFDQFDPVQIGLSFDYVKNSAFDLADIERRAGTTSVADLADKTTGVQARFQIGSRIMLERGSWTSFFALRRFDRDAWVDALTDTTWNLGGTNYQGYSLGGAYAFDRRATIGVRWTSTHNLDDGRRFLLVPGDATSVGGNVSSAPLKIDLLQVEVNAKF